MSRKSNDSAHDSSSQLIKASPVDHHLEVVNLQVVALHSMNLK